ncbi:hypothetical protein J3R03_003606 [Actinoplanes couchii]|nr:hypothetical protein [Actinoplanes couchii]
MNDEARRAAVTTLIDLLTRINPVLQPVPDDRG